MQGVEFYLFDDEVWCRYDDGRNEIVDEHNLVLVNYLYDKIRNCYQDAFAALESIYGKSRKNVTFYKYKLVRRFLKCNFSRMDSTYMDIDNIGGLERMNTEKVDCPLRGECQYDGVLCCAKISTNLSRSELRVARLWYEGCEKDDIAKELYLAFDTVNNHIRNIYRKIGVHDKAGFVKYVMANKLFV